MKLEYIEVPRNISNDELISDMIRVSQILNKSTLTAAEYDENGKFHSRTISKAIPHKCHNPHYTTGSK